MTSTGTPGTAAHSDAKAWTRVLTAYRKPDNWRSVFEIVVTAVPFVALWALAALAVVNGHYWGLILTIPAAGFLVRLFMLQHDCGHGSLFAGRLVNDWTGRVIGVLTFTPYDYWRRTHAIHHATTGNLDKRGIGDVDTLTVGEYRALSDWGRAKYRLYRHPAVMFGVGPAWLFICQYRLPFGLMRAGLSPWTSTLATNLAIAIPAALLIWLMGLWPFLAVQLPITLMAATAGVWLFYVQHQFEGVYWERTKNWDFLSQALQGSSYYHLPPLLQWFTGSIGFHHIHHLSPRIPNYLLGKCHSENELFQKAKKINLLQSLELVRYKLWDEKGQKLVTFSELRSMLRKRALV